MILKKLKIRNFCLIKDADIDFPEDANLINIYCNYYKNPNQSNRGGKSSIPESIYFNRYGLSTKGKGKDLINRDAKADAFVEATWDNGDKTIEIKRTIDYNSGKQILVVKGFEGGDRIKVQDELDKFFGVNSKEFILSSFISGRKIDTFMNLSNTEKRERVLKWIDDTPWELYEDKAKYHLEGINSEVKSMDMRKELLQEKLIDEPAVIEEVKKLNKSYKSSNAELVQIDEDVIEIRAIIDKGSQKGKIVGRKEKLLERISLKKSKLVKIDKYEGDIRDLDIKIFKKKNDAESLEKIQEKDREVKSEMHSIRREKESINSEIESMSEFEGSCPITKKTCNLINKDDCIDELNNKLKMKESIFKGYVDEHNDHKTKMEDLEDSSDGYQDLLIQKDRMQTSINEKSEMGMELIVLNKELSEIEEELKKIEDLDTGVLRDQLDDLTKRKYALKDEHRNTVSLLERYKNSLADNRQSKSDIETINEELTSLTEMQTIWGFLKYMYSKRGLPARIIENKIQDLEKDIDFILSEAGLDISVSFELQKETKVWEAMCLHCGYKYPDNREKECPKCKATRERKRSEKFDLKLFENGQEFSFESDSGAGTLLISFAIIIGLARLISNKNGMRGSDILVLDEITGQLDKVYKQSVMKIIQELLIGKLGYKQVFFITHSDMKDTFESNLKVTRYDKHSDVSWG